MIKITDHIIPGTAATNAVFFTHPPVNADIVAAFNRKTHAEASNMNGTLVISRDQFERLTALALGVPTRLWVEHYLWLALCDAVQPGMDVGRADELAGILLGLPAA